MILEFGVKMVVIEKFEVDKVVEKFGMGNNGIIVV